LDIEYGVFCPHIGTFQEAKTMLVNTKINVTHALSQADWLEDWAIEFIKAKKIEGLSPNTLRIYTQQLKHFLTFCEGQMLEQVSEVKSSDIRNFLQWLEDKGRNPGGRHIAYRILKTFFRWFDLEAEPENWRNPITKVKAPKLIEEPLEPIDVKVVGLMLDTCGSSFLGTRNRAILLFLLDTGLRARELLSINLEDVNLVTGNILVRKGKGSKPRTVFIGKETKRAVRAYLRERADILEALWVTDDQKRRLAYGGLRALLKRHARLARVGTPTAHAFRRAFAINMLRNGTDLVTLARLMGHSNLKVLQRYLKQLSGDLQEAHRRASPVDNWGL
jgi:integrase/recombinase XerD